MWLLGSLYVTSNMYFQEICGIQANLQAFCESGDYIECLTEKMKMKYKKYLGNLDKVNLMFLDLCTKLDALDYWFKEVLNVEQANQMITKLKHHVTKLYDHYDNIDGSSSRIHQGNDSPQCSSITINESKSGDISLHFMNKFHKYWASNSDVEIKSKIDHYLMEDVEKLNANFDIFKLVEG
jgi:uncharacterized protein YoxC